MGDDVLDVEVLAELGLFNFCVHHELDPRRNAAVGKGTNER